ncbi:MAG TPA: HK97 family phage prohead protease [Acidimicrobiales bacterium]|jgi:HK97 family phage prohead protease
MAGFLAANLQAGMEYRDVWTTAYINDLPDSAFLYIAPGGTKTNGKTDGAHRYFPVRDADGTPDAAHIKAAMSYASRSDLPETVRKDIMAAAQKMAAAHPGIGSGPTKEYQGSAGSGRSKPPAELAGMQIRTFEVTMELRSDGDGRTVLGRAVPYGQTADINGGRAKERFMMGAFNRQVAGGFDTIQRVKLHTSHTGRMAGDLLGQVGRTVHLAEQPDGLHGAWEIYKTPSGDHALELVKTGEVTGLSIGFKAVDGGTRKGADGAYEQHAAHLDHVALTNEPTYAGALVTSVRSVAHPIGGYRTDLLRARSILDRVLGG